MTILESKLYTPVRSLLRVPRGRIGNRRFFASERFFASKRSNGPLAMSTPYHTEKAIHMSTTYVAALNLETGCRISILLIVAAVVGRQGREVTLRLKIKVKILFLAAVLLELHVREVLPSKTVS